MAITFIAAGTKYESSGVSGTATPTLPSGGSAPAADDLILALFHCRSATDGSGWTTPTGFSLVAGIIGTGYGTSYLFSKVATGSDANPSSSWAGAGSLDTVVADIAVFRGVDTATPVMGSPSWTQKAGGDPVAPGITPSAGAGAVVAMSGRSTASAVTDLGGIWTQCFDSSSTLGSDAGIILEWAAWSSGAVANAAWAVSGTSNSNGMMIALKEAAAASAKTSRLALLGVN